MVNKEEKLPMTCIKLIRYGLSFIAVLFPFIAWSAGEMPPADSYLPSAEEMIEQKATLDDPTDLVVTYHPKDVLPPEIWKRMVFDEAEMKKQTAEIVGFTAPELVGKIAPEIKPGKYSYKDLEKYPGLKELFPPVVLNTIKAGGAPFVCNIMDFEIQPTRQFHWSLPVCEETRKNLGKSKLDKDGYIVPHSWQGGVPFPRPSGKFKAQQIYSDFEKRVGNYDECYKMTGEGLAFDKNLKMDKYIKYELNTIKLMGRAYLPPFGWFDKRAEKRGEFKATSNVMYEPRANRGMVLLQLMYDDPNKMDPWMIYLPQMRRIRKMSSTDTQDPQGDAVYDDRNSLSQKITPKRYPYKFEIIDECEYLAAVSYDTAGEWIDSKNGYAIRNLGMMRRTFYVLQMTQLDPNYIYSKRVYYMDKERFEPAWAMFYDQKGRLYRTYHSGRVFIPETGQLVVHGSPAWQVDYLDTHSSLQVITLLPANYSRNAFNLETLIRKGK